MVVKAGTDQEETETSDYKIAVCSIRGKSIEKVDYSLKVDAPSN